MAPDPTILIVEKGLLNPRSATLALPSPADFPALKNALSELFRLMGSEAILRRDEGSQRPIRAGVVMILPPQHVPGLLVGH